MKNTAKVLAALACLGLLLGGATSAALAQETGTGSTIKEITYEKVDDQLQVFIKIDGPFTFETLEVQAPHRMVLDFKGVSQIQAQPVIEINAAGVVSVRTGQFQPDVARVVFDMADKAPSHSLTQTENGLKVVFWLEEAQPQPEAKPAEVKPEPTPPVEAKPVEAKPEAQPAEVKPVEAKPAEVKPVESKPVAETPAVRPVEGNRDFFVHLAGGAALAGVPDTIHTGDITLYGEHGSIAQTYTLKTGWLADIAVGKYITPSIRVGLGASFGSADTTATIIGTFPHPFIMNQPRTVNFAAQELKNNLMNIYVFGMFTIVRAEKFELSLGPMLGYGKSDYQILQDFTFTDVSPFASENVTITSQTFVKDSISTPTAGAWLEGQYQLGSHLFLTLDARLLYFDAKVEALGKRANLSSIGLLLGLQYNF